MCFFSIFSLGLLLSGFGWIYWIYFGRKRALAKTLP